MPQEKKSKQKQTPADSDSADRFEPDSERPREIDGRKQGPEPTRYGDWEKNGRCIDF